MNLNFKMRGMEDIEKKIKNLPYGAKKVVLPAISEYLLGDDTHGLRHCPPLKDQEYLKHNPPTYERTNDAKNSWGIEGSLYRERIVSEGVDYVQYIPRWKKYGWREWMQVVNDNMAGAIRHGQAALNQWLGSL